MNTLPSSAYSVRPSICQPTVVTSCRRDRVGRVASSIRQFPEQPGVDGAEREPAGVGARPGFGHMVEQPANLARREVRVDEEAGAVLDHFAGTLGLQPLTILRGSPVLPHDRVVNRLTSVAVPEDRGLALVR